MDFTFNDALQLFIKLLITGILSIISKFIISFIKSKIEAIKVNTENERDKMLLDMINNIIRDCVIATNQTYVEALKDKNVFDQDAQLEAFQKTLQAVRNLLSEELLEFLNTAMGDADEYIFTVIEAEVNRNKGSK